MIGVFAETGFPPRKLFEMVRDDYAALPVGFADFVPRF